MLGLIINYEIKTEETNNAALLRYGKQKGDVRHSCEEEVRADKEGDSKCM